MMLPMYRRSGGQPPVMGLLGGSAPPLSQDTGFSNPNITAAPGAFPGAPLPVPGQFDMSKIQNLPAYVQPPQVGQPQLGGQLPPFNPGQPPQLGGPLPPANPGQPPFSGPPGVISGGNPGSAMPPQAQGHAWGRLRQPGQRPQAMQGFGGQRPNGMNMRGL